MAVSLPQSLASFVIPATDQNDPETVRSSLAQARSDLSRGELREALRHLRRAAEDADQAGSELRAVALARAAADLATEVGGASAAPPPVKEMPPLASTAPISSLRGNNDAALRQLLDSGRAVKVVVKRSARDEGLYVVRRAGGDKPTLGTREAVIVLLEPDDGFFAAEK
jgi:hypothetical protein